VGYDKSYFFELSLPESSEHLNLTLCWQVI